MSELQSIARYLTFLSDFTENLNALSDFSINRYAEDALIDTLNLVFSADLKNANVSQKNNPSIDLVDFDKSLGIQVTSDGSLDKIKSCIDKFYKHQVYKEVNELYVFLLTPYTSKIRQSTVDSYIAQTKKLFQSQFELKFELDKNVLDRLRLLTILQKLQLDKIVAIKSALKKQFDEYHSNDLLYKYNQQLEARFREPVFNDERGLTLEESYVDPHFMLHKSCYRDKQQEYSHDDFIPNKLTLHSLANDIFIAQNDNSEFKSSRLLILLGYPGQGKTSFCKKLCYDYVTNGLSAVKPIFYVKLKDVPNSRQLIHSPISVLHEEIQAVTGIEVSIDMLRNSVLILDGLDELYIKEGLSADDIEVLCKELYREINSNKAAQMQVVITSRKGYIDSNKFVRDNILVVQIASLDVQQQIKWLEVYRKYHPETWLTVEKIIFYNTRNNYRFSYIKELIEQPLLLHMIASLGAQVSNDVNRSAVYDQLFTELIQRNYSKDGQIQILKEISENDLRRVIRDIAFRIFQGGNEYIKSAEVLKLPSVQKFLDKLPKSEFKTTLKGLLIAFYFQEKQIRGNDDEDESYVIEFVHKSLQEYLVAEKIQTDIVNSVMSLNPEGDFIIDSGQDCLRLINRVFYKPLTGEIDEYLGEVLSRVDDDTKATIGKRLTLYLPYIISKDFLLELDSSEKNALSISLGSFKGIWLILRKLLPNENLLDDVVMAQAVQDYSCLCERFYSDSWFPDFSHQSFVNIRIRNCGLFSDERLFKTSFSSSNITESFFFHYEMEDCDFSGSEMWLVKFLGGDIINTSFNQATMQDVEFRGVSFSNVSFAGASIVDVILTDVTFKKMKASHFYGTHFRLEALVRFIQSGAKINLKRLGIVNTYSVDGDSEIEIPKNELEAFLSIELARLAE